MRGYLAGRFFGPAWGLPFLGYYFLHLYSTNAAEVDLSFSLFIYSALGLILFSEIIGPLAGVLSGFLAHVIKTRINFSIFLRLLLWGVLIWIVGFASEFLNEFVRDAYPIVNANENQREAVNTFLWTTCIAPSTTDFNCIVEEILEPFTAVLFVAIMEYMFETKLGLGHFIWHAYLRYFSCALLVIIAWIGIAKFALSGGTLYFQPTFTVLLLTILFALSFLAFSIYVIPFRKRFSDITDAIDRKGWRSGSPF